jgi:hypothetical protein
MTTGKREIDDRNAKAGRRDQPPRAHAPVGECHQGRCDQNAHNDRQRQHDADPGRRQATAFEPDREEGHIDADPAEARRMERGETGAKAYRSRNHRRMRRTSTRLRKAKLRDLR